MAKANITRPDGTKIVIEGEEEEVAGLVDRLSAPGSSGRRRSRKRSGGRKTQRTGKQRAPQPKGPTSYIREIQKEGFFKSKRSIADIKKKLAEKGHIYEVTSLSSPLVRLVRKRDLRRVPDKKGWHYVNP